jgi:Uma2 family endonuclease
MATTTSGLMTFEEFELLPEHTGKQELLQGELIELPPAKKHHDELAHRIFEALLDTLRRIRRETPARPLGKARLNSGYRVARNPDSWLIPDVSLTHPAQSGDEYYEGAPLIAVEVVSPSNTAEQIEAKIKVYLSNGAEEVWVFYPKTQSVYVHRKDGLSMVHGRLETELLPGFSLDLEPLFAA